MSKLHVMQDDVIKPTSMPLNMEHKCGNCRSYICRQLSEECICTSDSTFDISKIKDGPKKDFVELNREFSRQNPGVSLQLEAWELRKGIKAKFQPGPKGIIAHMGVGLALGDEVTDMDALDVWVAKADIDGEVDSLCSEASRLASSSCRAARRRCRLAPTSPIGPSIRRSLSTKTLSPCPSKFSLTSN